MTINYETEMSFSFIVYAEDLSGLASSPAEVTVRIVNRVDTLPGFEADPLKFSVTEGEPNGTLVGIVRATGENSSLLSYRIVANETIPFEIDSNSGNITTTMTLDRENSNMVVKYVFKVQASFDSFVTFSSVDVVITIDNFDDENPQFDLDAYFFNITETQQTDIIVGIVTASDPDGSRNILYEIIGGNIDETFELALNGRTCLLYTSDAADE